MAAKKAAAAAKAAQSEKDKRTLRKITELAQATLRAVEKGESPAVEIRTRSLSNVSFNPKKRIIELGDRAQSREFFNTKKV